MKPILFLGIDGVLYTYSELCPIPAPAKGFKEFWEWARENTDICWLTAWMVNRTKVPPVIAARLRRYIDVPMDEIMDCKAAPWIYDKDEGVRAVIGDSNRQWLWLEDELMPKEVEWLNDTGNMWRYVFCNVFHDDKDLIRATRVLKNTYERMNIERTG